jgi:hypothetical protein
MEILTWDNDEPIFKTSVEEVREGDFFMYLDVGDVNVGQVEFDHKPDGKEVANASVKVVRQWLEETSIRMTYLSGDNLLDGSDDLFEMGNLMED